MERIIEKQEAKLILEDGTIYTGHSFGYPASIAGEVVFNTGMVGYPEALSDPSYYGQILTMTFPLIGNYGMPSEKLSKKLPENYESGRGMISALIVDDYSEDYSHWNAELSLAQWLYNQKIPAINGIDTRSLTKKIREKGVMLGKIIFGNQDVEFYDPNQINLIEKVSIDKPLIYGKSKKRVMLIDCGCKTSIITDMLDRDVEIIRVPWNYPITDEKIDGLLISSGPGDPKMAGNTIKQVEIALSKEIPTFGICLGHQAMALAVGSDTYKLKYGHRSQNQPVINEKDQRCYITSQNHGYAVATEKLPKGWSSLFNNLNDGTCEGMIHESGRFFSVQFHPEASPGPVDTSFLFDQFASLL